MQRDAHGRGQVRHRVRPVLLPQGRQGRRIAEAVVLGMGAACDERWRQKMKGKTIRGLSGDRVRIVIDVDPLDAPLGHRKTDVIFVTASESNGSNERSAVCAMLTPKAALKLADTIRDLVKRRKGP